MFPRKYKKQNKLKKFLLKILNIYGFEKETLNLVNPEYKNSGNYFGEKYHNYKDKQIEATKWWNENFYLKSSKDLTSTKKLITV